MNLEEIQKLIMYQENLILKTQKQNEKELEDLYIKHITTHNKQESRLKVLRELEKQLIENPSQSLINASPQPDEESYLRWTYRLTKLITEKKSIF
jgi:hypothetical protein